jgi:hypothetical protein
LQFDDDVDFVFEIPWLGWAGSLHLSPVVLTPWMKGNLEDSVYEIFTN